jgi:LysR family transcriptional regulator, hydrogen peroxide-inducible genes activator
MNALRSCISKRQPENPLTLTELNYIVALGQERHFGRAAALCHVSQPTLSIAVKKFEQGLGVMLFERTGAGLRITPLGEQVVIKARRILKEVTEIKDLICDGKHPLVGPIALGTMPSIGPYLFPRFIPLLQQKHPRMPLRLEESDTATLKAKLRNGDLDVVLTTTPFSMADVVTQPLFDENFVLLLRADDPLAARSAIAPPDLEPNRLLTLVPGHDCYDALMAWLPQLGQAAATARSSATSLETLRHMVASGGGMTVLPEMAANVPYYAPNLVTTRSFIAPAPTRTLALAWRATFPRHQAIDAVRDAIQASSPPFWQYTTDNRPNALGIMVQNQDW